MKTIIFAVLFAAIAFSSVDAKACVGRPLSDKEKLVEINQVVTDILNRAERSIESVTKVTTKLNLSRGMRGDCKAITISGEVEIRFGRDCFGKYTVEKVDSDTGNRFELTGKAICL